MNNAFHSGFRRTSLLYVYPIQCRINNNSKCINRYRPHTFGGPAVLYVIFVLYYMQGWILEFRYPRQILERGL